MRSLLVFLSAFVLAHPGLSDSLERLEIKFYGEFIHTEKLPKTLFMFDEIEAMQSFHLRKALREHEIETVVLSSDGGQVFEALQMSAIINDNNLNTYIPEQGIYGDGVCASACAYMFFAGESRIADGELGVHQFKSNEPEKALRGDDLETNTQFVVSEITGYLADYDIPDFVLPKMFQSDEMYYFRRSEKREIERNLDSLSTSDIKAIDEFIADFRIELKRLASSEITREEHASVSPIKSEDPVVERATTKDDVKERTKEVQKQLNRLGCGAGIADGILGRKTKRALARYNKVNSPTIPIEMLLEPVSLSNMKSAKNRCIKEAERTKQKSKNANSLVCKMQPNSDFERMFKVEDFVRRTDEALNSLRQFEIEGENLIIQGKTMKKTNNGYWKKSLPILCEDNHNGWSPCGTFTGVAEISLLNRANAKAKLLLPWTWSRGLHSVIYTDYTCQ